MPTSPLSAAVQHLLADLRPDGDGMTDGELLARFLGSRDEDALAALVASTIKAASLLAAGQAATTGVISAKVAVLTEGMVRAMFLAKLKTVTCALALTVLVGLGGGGGVPGGGPPPAAGAATAPQEGGDGKPAAEAQKLVRQL